MSHGVGKQACRFPSGSTPLSCQVQLNNMSVLSKEDSCGGEDVGFALSHKGGGGKFCANVVLMTCTWFVDTEISCKVVRQDLPGIVSQKIIIMTSILEIIRIIVFGQLYALWLTFLVVQGLGGGHRVACGCTGFDPMQPHVTLCYDPMQPENAAHSKTCNPMQPKSSSSYSSSSRKNSNMMRTISSVTGPGARQVVKMY